MMQKKGIALLCLLAALLLCSACRSGQIMQQLHGDRTTSEPDAPATTTAPLLLVTPAAEGAEPAAIGTKTADGAVVTGASEDGAVYYAALYNEAGAVQTELTYASGTETVLFRTEYSYAADGLLLSKKAVAVADKAYGYVGTDGQTTPCREIYSEYADGRETYVFYRDFQGDEVALTLTAFDTDGSFVRRFYEYGKLVFVRSYNAAGTLLFSSETGALSVGATVNLGGGMGNGTVTQLADDGSLTVKFINQSHNMTDGTGYVGLTLYMELNADFRPTQFYYQQGDTEIARYEVRYAEDRSYVQTYYEFEKQVCSLAYDSSEKLLSITDADGNTVAADDAALQKPTVGQMINGGLICQVNEDGSFVVVYTNKTYRTLAGKTLEDTTLYSFYTAARKLNGNKYYYGSECLAEYDLYYNEDGSYSVNIFEGGTLAATIEYDTAGKALRAYDAKGNLIASGE